MEKIKGVVEHVSEKTKGVQVNGAWYTLDDNAARFMPKPGDTVTMSVQNGKVSFIKVMDTDQSSGVQVQKDVIVSEDGLKEKLASDMRWAFEEARKISEDTETIQKIATTLFLAFQRRRR